jgi:hypothetical protein
MGIRSAADLLKNPLLRRAVNAGGFVYFVSDGTNIKIGLTRTGVAGRVRSLQTGASAVLPDADREAELHQRFRHLHVRGEWFQPGPDLLAFIDQVNRGEGTGPLAEEGGAR